MAREYVLSERDYQRMQNALRWYERNKNPHELLRRRNVTIGGGGGNIKKAYCKTAAPASDEIVCYLNTDVTGEEITVKCLITGGTKLDEAIPLLVISHIILVEKIDDVWWCLYPFQAIDTTELQFESGILSTKLSEC